ncbi:GTP cyclohydrolase, FolE2/MptA family [Mycobacterium sp. PDNC021]|uniref:GTP cyclohydrolase, FolE2/MptA family n=1 Tax=Mycobacterium sp. PDNC021 TaxID=3391399 RepID=UPI003AABEDAC
MNRDAVASAALARQEIQEAFVRDFATEHPLDHTAVYEWLGSERGICATPHSQRSVAQMRARLDTDAVEQFPVVEIIDHVEQVLATPVQTAVKREDEQAFAMLNGANLMFCKDAARRVQATLDTDERIADFHVRIAHLESLHAHDAVAEASKQTARPSRQGRRTVNGLRPTRSGSARRGPGSDAEHPEGEQQLTLSRAADAAFSLLRSFFLASRFFLLVLLMQAILPHRQIPGVADNISEYIDM